MCFESRLKTSPPPSPRLPFSTRARATLAMSVQVHPAIIDSPSNHYHQPSPRQPAQNLLDMYPGPSNPRRNSVTSRPISPLVTRPSSRSEKLLRDTLRRADEHDRAQERPFFVSSAMSFRREDESSDCECDDIDNVLWRSASGSSGDSADYTIPSRVQLVRNKSLEHKPSYFNGSPTSPRRSLHRSPNSAPMVIRVDEDVTPHDAVLRSRLEGVLGNAADQKRKRRSARSISRVRAHTRDSSEDWTVSTPLSSITSFSHTTLPV